MTTKTNKYFKKTNKQNLGNLPIWDLSDLYDSIESKKISSDLEFIEIKAKEFEKNYEGKMIGFEDQLSDKEIDSILAYVKSFWPIDKYEYQINMSK